MIVVIANVKGGTGKTTIATNLAITRAKNASDVLLVDSDTQKSSSDFADVREQEGHQPEITCISLIGRNTGSEIRKLVNKFDDIIVDVGGRDTSTLRSVLLIADVLVVPFLASQFDVWALELINRVIDEVKQLNEKLKVISFLNKVDTNPRVDLAEEASSIAKEFPHLNFKDLNVSHRVAFRRSIAEGLGVAELKKGRKDTKAEQEIEELYRGVFANA